jgi:hypothetical protein
MRTILFLFYQYGNNSSIMIAHSLLPLLCCMQLKDALSGHSYTIMIAQVCQLDAVDVVQAVQDAMSGNSKL